MKITFETFDSLVNRVNDTWHLAKNPKSRAEGMSYILYDSITYTLEFLFDSEGVDAILVWTDPDIKDKMVKGPGYNTHDANYSERIKTAAEVAAIESSAEFYEWMKPHMREICCSCKEDARDEDLCLNSLWRTVNFTETEGDGFGRRKAAYYADEYAAEADAEEYPDFIDSDESN